MHEDRKHGSRDLSDACRLSIRVCGSRAAAGGRPRASFGRIGEIGEIGGSLEAGARGVEYTSVHAGGHMFIVRETFIAKPGKASALAKLFKEVMAEITQMKPRVSTDYIGQFNSVVLETECEDLAQFEKSLSDYMSRQDLRDKMKGYTDMYQEGKREVFKVV
jgi:hypothetical protein